MSLSLLQSYSSAEEEEDDEEPRYDNASDSDSDSDAGDVQDTRSISNKPLFEAPKSSSSSLLPSALDAFSEVAGPPEFLNNCVEEPVSAATDLEGHRWRHGRRRHRKDKNDLPAGAVMEAKAQLVGIHERVRSDVEGNITQAPSSQANGSNATQGVKRVATATNPNAEDAAELLRMCLQCGVPKTYSNARGMVCPLCSDRPPPTDAEKEAAKKKGSLIKDKEKSKRMKGQSSHATWKSETEMQLRQQFD
ncbi:hypothetical protein LguiB_006856 [Lonicera macranthoides]